MSSTRYYTDLDIDTPKHARTRSYISRRFNYRDYDSVFLEKWIYEDSEPIRFCSRCLFFNHDGLWIEGPDEGSFSPFPDTYRIHPERAFVRVLECRASMPPELFGYFDVDVLDKMMKHDIDYYELFARLSTNESGDNPDSDGRTFKDKAELMNYYIYNLAESYQLIGIKDDRKAPKPLAFPYDCWVRRSTISPAWFISPRVNGISADPLANHISESAQPKSKSQNLPPRGIIEKFTKSYLDVKDGHPYATSPEILEAFNQANPEYRLTDDRKVRATKAWRTRPLQKDRAENSPRMAKKSEYTESQIANATCRQTESTDTTNSYDDDDLDDCESHSTPHKEPKLSIGLTDRLNRRN